MTPDGGPHISFQPDETAVAQSRQLELADGRTIGCFLGGDPEGAPLLCLHGTPGTGAMFAVAGEAARRRGLRLIAVDRWGYGATTPHPVPSLAAFGRDIGELADRLGLGRLSVLGYSGGGPFALAAAACLGGRVDSLTLVAPVARLAELPDSSLSLLDRVRFRIWPRIPGAVDATFIIYRAMLQCAPSMSVRLLWRRVEADRDLLDDPELCLVTGRALLDGLAAGAHGPRIDLACFSASWDVEPADVTARTRIWMGTSDRDVPLAPIAALASEIPEAELTELPGEGHLWLGRNFRTVLDWIVGGSDADRGDEHDAALDLRPLLARSSAEAWRPPP